MNPVRKPNKEQEEIKQELQKWCNIIDKQELWVDNSGVPSDAEGVVSFVLTPIANTNAMVLSLSIYTKGLLKRVASRNQFRKLMDLVDRTMILDVKQLYEYSEAITLRAHNSGYFRSLWSLDKSRRIKGDYWFIKKHNCHRLFFLPRNSIGVLHDTLFSTEVLRQMCIKTPALQGVYINPVDIYYTSNEIIASKRHPILTQ